MGDDRWDEALLADALLHAGKFADAQAAFKAYLASVEDALAPENHEWYLKTLVLPEIVERRECVSQERRLGRGGDQGRWTPG